MTFNNNPGPSNSIRVSRRSARVSYSEDCRSHAWLQRCLLIVLSAALALPPAWAIDFDFDYLDNVQGDFLARGWLAQDSDFQRNIRAATTEWAKYINSNSTLTILVRADRGIARAGGTFSLGVFLGLDASARNVFEPGPLSRIRTGSNPGGPTDIFLIFNAQFIDDNYWLDPTPEDLSDLAPVGKTDFLWIVMHELGHGLGMAGFRSFDPASYGEFVGSTITSFDELTFYDGNGDPRAPSGELNSMFFAGASASALFGSPAPLSFLEPTELLASQNYYHLGTCGDPPIVEDSLMRGCFAPVAGNRFTVSPIDVAVLADLGYPASVNPDFIFNDGFE